MRYNIFSTYFVVLQRKVSCMGTLAVFMHVPNTGRYKFKFPYRFTEREALDTFLRQRLHEFGVGDFYLGEIIEEHCDRVHVSCWQFLIHHDDCYSLSINWGERLVSIEQNNKNV